MSLINLPARCPLVALTYAKAWSRATILEQTKHVYIESFQDQETMQTMQDGVVVVDVAKQVQVTMKQHLWYFCEILNGLAFFE